MYDVKATTIKGEDILIAVFSDMVDREIIIEFVKILAKSKTEYPGDILLVDFTAVNKVDIKFADIMAISKYVKSFGRRFEKTAFVTGKDISKFLIAKLYVESVGFLTPDLRKAFQDSHKAIEWLCQDIALNMVLGTPANDVVA
jgi:hypothetical protein